MSFVADLTALVAASVDHRHRCPDDWPRVSLGSVAKIINGYPFKSGGFGTVGHPVIRIRDVARGFTTTCFEGDAPPGFWVKQGDLIVGMDGDFQTAFWRSEPALLNQRVCKVVPDETRIDHRYLAYILPGYLELINANTPSVTVKHLSSRTLASIPLPLPPLAHQARIADRIDELFAEIDDGEAALARARDDLATWRKALLKAAVTGELTADWRTANPAAETGTKFLASICADRRIEWAADGKKKTYKEPASPRHDELPPIPESWCWATIEQLCEATRPVAYGVLQPGDDLDEGVPLVRVTDVRDGVIACGELKRISVAIADAYPRTKLRGGEVLLTVVGSVGRTAIVPPSLAGANTARAVSVLPITHASAKWIELALRYEPYRAALENSSHEVARKTLNLEDVRAFPLPVPPLAEQEELVRRISLEFDAERLLRATKAEASQMSATLRQSILAAASRGELA